MEATLPAGSSNPVPEIATSGLLDGLLAEILALHRESDGFLVPSRPWLTERVSGKRPGGLELNEEALATRADACGVLASWAWLVVDEKGAPHPEECSAGVLAHYLRGHVGWLAAHTSAGDLVDELKEVRAALSALVGAAQVDTVALGPCPLHSCGGTALRVRRRSGPSHVACDMGHPLAPHQWLLVDFSAREAR